MTRTSTTVVLGVALALLAFGYSQEPSPLEAPGDGPLGALAASCDGLETLCDIAIPLQAGTGILAAGAGLVDGQPGTINIDVPGDVVQVLVFWEGFNASNAETPDNQIMVGTETITGDLVGPQHKFFSDNYTSVHRADITSYGLVIKGDNAISVGGMDFSKKNNGVGMLVIYDEGGATADIGVKEGDDAAFHTFDEPLDTTVPQTFTFDPQSTERTATLYLFVSSVAHGRPTVIEVTVGGSVERFIDLLDDQDGARFDTQKIEVTVPAGASSLTVQVLSEKDGESQFSDPRPASLVWLAAGLSVPGVEEDCEGCTPGYWKNHSGSWAATGYDPDDDFDDTFGVDYFDPDITLCEALRNGGGGVNALGRHAVAALLNGAHGDVNYCPTESEILEAVSSMDKDFLESFNQQYCPIGGRSENGKCWK